MKLNIQLFAKKTEEKEIEKELEQEEENQADKIAELTVDLDLEKERSSELQKQLDIYKKKYDDEHKANLRLISRINDKEDYKEKNEAEKAIKMAKITDLYDYKSGCLVLK